MSSKGFTQTKVLRALNTKGKDYIPMYKAAAEKHGVPFSILVAQAAAENGFWNPDIISGKQKSSAGALGIGQFMPATAEQYGINPLDPEQSIDAQAKYLANGYKMHGSWDKALAGYNAGDGAVQKHGGIPPYKETQDYVAKIGSVVGGYSQYQGKAEPKTTNDKEPVKVDEPLYNKYMPVGSTTTTTEQEPSKTETDATTEQPLYSKYLPSMKEEPINDHTNPEWMAKQAEREKQGLPVSIDYLQNKDKTFVESATSAVARYGSGAANVLGNVLGLVDKGLSNARGEQAGKGMLGQAATYFKDGSENIDTLHNSAGFDVGDVTKVAGEVAPLLAAPWLRGAGMAPMLGNMGIQSALGYATSNDEDRGTNATIAGALTGALGAAGKVIGGIGKASNTMNGERVANNLVREANTVDGVLQVPVQASKFVDDFAPMASQLADDVPKARMQDLYKTFGVNNADEIVTRGTQQEKAINDALYSQIDNASGGSAAMRTRAIDDLQTGSNKYAEEAQKPARDLYVENANTPALTIPEWDNKVFNGEVAFQLGDVSKAMQEATKVGTKTISGASRDIKPILEQIDAVVSKDTGIVLGDLDNIRKSLNKAAPTTVQGEQAVFAGRQALDNIESFVMDAGSAKQYYQEGLKAMEQPYAKLAGKGFAEVGSFMDKVLSNVDVLKELKSVKSIIKGEAPYSSMAPDVPLPKPNLTSIKDVAVDDVIQQLNKNGRFNPKGAVDSLERGSVKELIDDAPVTDALVASLKTKLPPKPTKAEMNTFLKTKEGIEALSWVTGLVGNWFMPAIGTITKAYSKQAMKDLLNSKVREQLIKLELSPEAMRTMLNSEPVKNWADKLITFAEVTKNSAKYSATTTTGLNQD